MIPLITRLFRRGSYAPLPPHLILPSAPPDTSSLDAAQTELEAEIAHQAAALAEVERFDRLKRFTDARDAARDGMARRDTRGRFLPAPRSPAVPPPSMSSGRWMGR